VDTVKIFIKDDCPKCPAAKKLYNDLVSGLAVPVNIEKCNVGSRDGLAEAAMHMVLATPSVLVFDGDENKIAEWRGDVPTISQIELALKEHTLNDKVVHAPLP